MMPDNDHVFQAQYLTYGKVVSADNGSIASNAGERVTSYSDRLPREIRLTATPETVMRPAQWQRSDVALSRRESGFLIIREAVGSIPGVLARISFPPENRSETGGRHYTQMQAAFIPEFDWRDYTPAILAAGLDTLSGAPDTVARISHLGDVRPALEMPLQRIRVPDRRQLAIVWEIINALARTGKFCAGSESFQSENQFLAVCGLLLSFSPVPSGNQSALMIVSGLQEENSAGDLVFLPDAAVAQPAQTLQSSRSAKDFTETFCVAEEWADLCSEMSAMQLSNAGGDHRSSVMHRYQTLIGKISATLDQRNQPDPVHPAQPVNHPAGMHGKDATHVLSPKTVTVPPPLAPQAPLAPLFRPGTRVPLLDAALRSQAALRDMERRKAETAQRRIPDFAQALQAARGNKVLLSANAATRRAYYRISVSHGGIRDLRQFMAANPPAADWSGIVNQFWNDHGLLFDDELVRIRHNKEVEKLLLHNATGSADLNKNLAAAAAFERMKGSERKNWAGRVLETLIVRLEHGVQLPLVRTVVDAVGILRGYNSEEVDKIEKVIAFRLQDCAPFPGALPEDKRTFRNDLSALQGCFRDGEAARQTSWRDHTIPLSPN